MAASHSLFGCQKGVVNATQTFSMPTAEPRLHPRTHLFVAATLYADSASGPVHIRNMSLNGANIEGIMLPDPGARIILKRGSLEASGQMAWREGKRGGVAFSGAVEVSEWMAKVREPQAKIDQLVRALKANRTVPASLAPAPAPTGGQLTHREELEALRAEIAQLGNSLSSDVILVATHPEIQLFDIALQRIDRLIERS